MKVSQAENRYSKGVPNPTYDVKVSGAVERMIQPESLPSGTLRSNDVYEWLLTHVGPGNQRNFYMWADDDKWRWRFYDNSEGSDAILFAFADADAAMLFKLTWA